MVASMAYRLRAKPFFTPLLEHLASHMLLRLVVLDLLRLKTLGSFTLSRLAFSCLAWS